MTQINKEQLIELITKEVLRTLGERVTDKPDEKTPRPSALVLGKPEKLPVNLGHPYTLMDVEDYAACGDIEKYEKIFITEISLTELSDIALGRNSRPASCAVVSGLLCGKEIILLEGALTHRKHAGKGSRVFYQMLEGYVQTLQGFGIKLEKDSIATASSAVQDQTPEDLPKGVITEMVAKALVGKAQGGIRLRKGTVVTPSAKDVFHDAGKTIQFI